MENICGKKRPSINLKLFSSLSNSFSNPNPTKSPRNFQDGVVGLGIVAAMADSTHTPQAICFAPSPRSTPIPIVSSTQSEATIRENFDELSENYTCIISHVGDDKENCSVFTTTISPRKNNMGQFKRQLWSDDFLTSCHLCRKELHGLDIFMYRGEKAFCSAECREKQITSENDDYKEKEICGAEARSRRPLDCSVSPCSGTQVFFTGVAAA
ncbi:hypothetical protein DITRI_Ditri05aG0149400 [Diplodiscus trichospermus]